MSEKITYYPYEPDHISPPGDTLLDMLEERGMTQTELAQRTSRPQKTINGIIKGHKAITAETALQLEKVFGVSARFWLAREQDYREFLARQVESDVLRPFYEWVNNFPIDSMHKLNWLPQQINPHERLVALLQFFGIAHPNSWEDVWQNSLVNYRKTEAFVSSDYALSVWLRQAEIEAQEIYTSPYDRAAFHELLVEQIRPFTRQNPEQFHPRLVELCADVGVAVVVIPQVDGARVSGAAGWLSKDKALIQLSLRYKTNDHFWFSFFHEAGHIIKHSKKQFFIETENDTQNQLEQEANQFAANLLIPPTRYRAFIQSNKPFSRQKVQQFAEQINIAPGIVVGRLQHDKQLPYTHLNNLKTKFKWVNTS